MNIKRQYIVLVYHSVLLFQIVIKFEYIYYILFFKIPWIRNDFTCKFSNSTFLLLW